MTLYGVEAKVGDTVTLGGGPTGGRGSEGTRAWLNPPPAECISDDQWLVSSQVVEEPDT